MNYILFAFLGVSAFITIVFCYTPSSTHDDSGRKLAPSRTLTPRRHHDEKYQNEQMLKDAPQNGKVH
jgi:hypothetical protein